MDRGATGPRSQEERVVNIDSVAGNQVTIREDFAAGE